MTKRIFKYIISSIVGLLLFSNAMAQKDSTTFRKNILRINLDLASPFYSYVFDTENKRSGFEAMVEYSFNDTLFFIVEAGFHQLHTIGSTYESSSNGMFLRLGANRNLMKYYNSKDRDIFYIGARLSGSSYKVHYPFVNIDDSYWGTQLLNDPYHYNFAIWGEAVLGMRIETLKNLFLGWDLRGNVKFYDSNQSTFKTLFIPGFGNPLNRFSLWLNYSIGYSF